ncbi:MAG: hypothetical protein KF908_10245 [Nitrosomonas sp.]|nr:hypothetical protein [Nitrosomonas sp.]MCW5608277.1 hypothetical protein [Nitrosomonas sp.]
MDRILSIELNLEEGSLLLTALAECPFKTVFELIGKLNHQAHLHFTEISDHTLRRPFEFTEQELALSMKALGRLPYEHVHQLLNSLNRQQALQLQTEDNHTPGHSRKKHADH